MRSVIPVACLVVGGLFSHVASANGLEQHQHEVAATFSYTDTDNFGSTTDLAGRWLYRLGAGYFQVGGIVSYFDIDADGGGSTDALAAGPVVLYNFMPSNEAYTPFVAVAVQGIGGDAGDSFDYTVAAGVGIRVYVGDSAALNFSLERDRSFGATGVNDQDSTVLAAGISVFFGGR